MLEELAAIVPREAAQIGIVLALASFIGIEREEHKQREAVYAFGGVRTFPLIGLVSYALALLSAPGFLPWTVGFAAVGAFMLLSYHHKLSGDPAAGLANEISALITFVVAGLVQREHYWIATTVGVLSVLLLEVKKGLESLARHVASSEIITVAKFLFLAAVVLPVVPDRPFTRFDINPLKSWLVVVAVSGVSFASYVLQRLLRDRAGLMLSAILGGAYSSTVTTVVLARQAKEDKRPNAFAGSVLTASGVMYARLVVLVALFSRTLAARLAPSFGALGCIGCLVGVVVYRRDREGPKPRRRRETKNPLELGTAFLFALVFVVVLVLTNLAREYLGGAGLYTLATIMGVTDVDPFILGLTQTSTATVPLGTAAAAIVLAAASNNVIKAFYAYSFADRATGRKCLVLLLLFAALGVVPLAWI